jgi:hypothetical protein
MRSSAQRAKKDHRTKARWSKFEEWRPTYPSSRRVSMTNGDGSHPTNSSSLEDQLGDMVQSELRRVPRQRQVVVPHPAAARIPNYVEHNEAVDEVGRLSSEALVMTYEASAKRIEAMGTGLLEAMSECRKSAAQLVKELERVEEETEQAVKQCLAAAEVYRSQAKELFENIQNRAILAAKVRETASIMIEELKK